MSEEPVSSSAGHALQRAELALRWFEAHDTWSGKWDRGTRS